MRPELVESALPPPFPTDCLRHACVQQPQLALFAPEVVIPPVLVDLLLVASHAGSSQEKRIEQGDGSEDDNCSIASFDVLPRDVVEVFPLDKVDRNQPGLFQKEERFFDQRYIEGAEQGASAGADLARGRVEAQLTPAAAVGVPPIPLLVISAVKFPVTSIPSPGQRAVAALLAAPASDRVVCRTATLGITYAAAQPAERSSWDEHHGLVDQHLAAEVGRA